MAALRVQRALEAPLGSPQESITGARYTNPARSEMGRQ